MSLVKVYRGVANAYLDKKNNIGIHWTSDPTVAFNFSRGVPAGGIPAPHTLVPDATTGPVLSDRWDKSLTPKKEESYSRPGVVYEGYVHRNHILVPGTDEHYNYSDAYDIYGPEHDEQEVTLRHGSPIHIVRQHLIGRQFSGGLDVIHHPTGLTVTA